MDQVRRNKEAELQKFIEQHTLSYKHRRIVGTFDGWKQETFCTGINGIFDEYDYFKRKLEQLFDMHCQSYKFIGHYTFQIEFRSPRYDSFAILQCELVKDCTRQFVTSLADLDISRGAEKQTLTWFYRDIEGNDKMVGPFFAKSFNISSTAACWNLEAEVYGRLLEIWEKSEEVPAAQIAAALLD